MQKRLKVMFLLTALVVLIVQIMLLLKDNNFAVLNPKGFIASEQKDLFVFTVVLSLVVIVPVFIMVFLFAHKYNEKNTKAKYTPDWENHKIMETIWWGVPIVLILILSIVTFKSAHDLDPFKPINAEGMPLKVQVVALQWKWLFIYPEEEIATVNYLKIPVNRAVEFNITADAPMNSFWIPQLGGQIYAMSGMSTELNLLADEIGEYRGSSANLSGKGFASMNFPVIATSETDFKIWVKDINDGVRYDNLDEETYKKIREPSENNTATFYHLQEPKLYQRTVMKYMQPHKDGDESGGLMLMDGYGDHR